VAKVCQRTSYTQDQYIVREAAEGMNFFILENGVAVASTSISPNSAPVVLRTYMEGEHFGELGPLTGEKRKANVRAETNVDVIYINKRSFSLLPQAVLQRLRGDGQSYLYYDLVDPLSGVLPQMAFLEGLDDQQIWGVAKLCQKLHVTDEVLPIGGCFYILIDGCVIEQVRVDHSPQPVVINTHRTCGDYFGEVALLRPDAQRCEAVAVGSTTLLTIEQSLLQYVGQPLLDLLARSIPIQNAKLVHLLLFPQSKLCDGLEDTTLKEFARILVPEQKIQGSCIIEANMPCEELYVLQTGSVVAVPLQKVDCPNEAIGVRPEGYNYKKGDILKRYKPGDIFGGTRAFDKALWRCNLIVEPGGATLQASHTSQYHSLPRKLRARLETQVYWDEQLGLLTLYPGLPDTECRLQQRLLTLTSTGVQAEGTSCPSSPKPSHTFSTPTGITAAPPIVSNPIRGHLRQLPERVIPWEALPFSQLSPEQLIVMTETPYSLPAEDIAQRLHLPLDQVANVKEVATKRCEAIVPNGALQRPPILHSHRLLQHAWYCTADGCRVGRACSDAKMRCTVLRLHQEVCPVPRDAPEPCRLCQVTEALTKSTAYARDSEELERFDTFCQEEYDGEDDDAMTRTVRLLEAIQAYAPRDVLSASSSLASLLGDLVERRCHERGLTVEELKTPLLCGTEFEEVERWIMAREGWQSVAQLRDKELVFLERNALRELIKVWLQGDFDRATSFNVEEHLMWKNERQAMRSAELQQLLLHAYNCPEKGGCSDLRHLCVAAKGTLSAVLEHSEQGCQEEDWTSCGLCRLWTWLRPNVRKVNDGPEMLIHCSNCEAKPGRCRRGIPCKNGKKTWELLSEHFLKGCDMEITNKDVKPECQRCNVYQWVTRCVSQCGQQLGPSFGPEAQRTLELSLPPSMFQGRTKAAAEELKPEDDLRTKESRDVLAHSMHCRLQNCEYGALCLEAKSKVRNITKHITVGCAKGPAKCGLCKVWRFLQKVPKPELAKGGSSLDALVNGVSVYERADVLELIHQDDDGSDIVSRAGSVVGRAVSVFGEGAVPEVGSSHAQGPSNFGGATWGGLGLGLQVGTMNAAFGRAGSVTGGRAASVCQDDGGMHNAMVEVAWDGK